VNAKMSEITTQPFARDVPVAVAGDLVLVRESGLLVSAGAFTVWSTGFGFELHVAADAGNPEVSLPGDMWSLDRDWRDRCTWMSVHYSDGRACDANMNWCTLPDDESNTKSTQLRVEFTYSPGELARCSRWWVSPLPPVGPVKLTIHLDGRDGPVGTASLQAGPLLAAASELEKVS
jgi:hypothetical protein